MDARLIPFLALWGGLNAIAPAFSQEGALDDLTRQEIEAFHQQMVSAGAEDPSAEDLRRFGPWLELTRGLREAGEPDSKAYDDAERALLWHLGAGAYSSKALPPPSEDALRDLYRRLYGRYRLEALRKGEGLAGELIARLETAMTEHRAEALRRAPVFSAKEQETLTGGLGRRDGPRDLDQALLDRALETIARIQQSRPRDLDPVHQPLSDEEHALFSRALSAPQDMTDADAEALNRLYAKIAGFASVREQFAPLTTADALEFLRRKMLDVVHRRYQVSTNVLRDGANLMSEEEVTLAIERLERLDDHENAEPWPLSLDQALDLALDKNLDLKIAHHSRRINAELVLAAEAAFEPLLSTSSTFSTTQTPPSSETTRTRRKSANSTAGSASAGGGGASAIAAFLSQGNPQSQTSRATVNSLAVSKAWAPGTQTSVSYRVQRAGYEQNPIAYTQSFAMSLTQPLLKGFGLSAALYQARSSRIDEDKAEHDLELARMQTLFSVEQAYWNLRFTRQNLEVTRQALANARTQTAIAAKKYEVGTVAKIDVKSALASEARAVSALLLAQSQAQGAQDALLALIRPELEPGRWHVLVEQSTNIHSVVDDLDWAGLDFERAFAKAQQHRPDIRKAELEYKKAALTFDYRRNQRWPSLDLEGSGGWQGRAEDSAHGFKSMYQRHYWNYSVGLSLSLPLGNQAASAQYRQAQAGKDIAELTLLKTKIQARQAVRGAVRDLHAKATNIDVTRNEVILQEMRYKSEQIKYEHGLSTQVDVDIANKDLAQARTSHEKALIDAAIAWAALQNEMGLYRRDLVNVGSR